MRRALVTGATGFMGANLVRTLLVHGHEVHALVRPTSDLKRLEDVRDRIIFHSGDLTSNERVRDVLAMSRPHSVFHLAGYGASGNERDEGHIESTITAGTRALFDACTEQNSVEAVIHAGSAAEYGVHTDPLREDTVPAPTTAYGRAKLAATSYGEDLRNQTGAPITTLRVFNAYGPFDVPARFMAACTLAFLSGSAPSLSNPDTVRDFIYIDDVIEAFLRASKCPPGVYNIGTGVETSLSQAADLIQKALGTSIPVQWGGEQGRGNDSGRFIADTERAQTVLGWAAATSIEEGVTRMTKWFASHRSLYA